MPIPTALLAVALIFLAPVLAQEKDNGDECACFRTNSSSAGYFTNHRFLDYRYVADAGAAPAVLLNATGTTNAVATSDFFLSDDWTKDWNIQNWNNSEDFADSGATVLMINSPNNVYIESSTDNSTSYSSFLTLRTTRLPTFQSAAEIDSVEADFQYLSARFLARVTGSPGACAGIFTYLATNSTNPLSVQEADVEILTRDPRNRVQYTNQPSTDSNGDVVPAATVNGTNPTQDWSEWNIYRVDWMPKETSWYVNGVNVANISYQVPKDPAALIVNMWSDGGVWTQNMSVYDEAFLQIQWIDMVYNTSGPYLGEMGKMKRDEFGAMGVLGKRKGTTGCKVVCSVDEEVNVTGTPAVVLNNTAVAVTRARRDGIGYMPWIPLALIGALVFGYL